MYSSAQKELLDYFENATRKDALRQCYIINGEAGVGKSFVLNKIKEFIICDTNTACGKCNSCMSLKKGANPDCHEVSNGDKKLIALDKIRAMIKEVYIKPVGGRYKLFVIENAHLMEAPAQNALLKVIEEPPSYAVFILVTDNIGTMLATILSRSMILEQKRWSREDLQRVCPLPTEDGYLYDCALGNIGTLLSMASDEKFRELREGVISAFTKAIRNDGEALYEEIDFWLSHKDSKESLTDILTMFIRDIVFYKSGCMQNITNKDKLKEIQTVSELISLKKSYKMLEIIADAPRMLGRYGNFAMLVHSIFIDIDDTVKGGSI